MLGFATAMFGAVLGIISLLIYIPLQVGEKYLAELSKGFLFGGGDSSVPQYCIGLFFESAAGAMVICFCLMQYWKTKVETINK